MKTYLGLGGSLHDYSACVIKPDDTLYTMEVERLTRKRYAVDQFDQHRMAVEYICNLIGIEKADVSFVGDDMISSNEYADRYYVNHHEAHAASSFFQSPFEDADILVIDGVGSSKSGDELEKRETISFYQGAGNDLKLLDRIYGEPTDIRVKPGSPRIRTNSIGDWYRLWTEILGFHYLQAGKTMGLSPFGVPPRIEDLDTYIDISQPKNLLINFPADALNCYMSKSGKYSLEQSVHQEAANIAAFAQAGAERCIEHCLRHLKTLGRSKNLCVTGGVAQNSIAMGKLEKFGYYENIFVDHAPGDYGVSIGAAILGRIRSEPKNKIFRIKPNPFTQVVEPENKIEMAQEAGLQIKPMNAEQVAHQLADGKIIATHFGQSEFGARALGHRSIIADPRDEDMVKRINQIKGREWFRPVAPCVMAERACDFFETNLDCEFMQYVVPVLSKKIQLIPAAVHIDGSARAQFVYDKVDPLFSLLRAFEKLTGIPVLLNTSFNIAGRAMVHSFKDGLSDFSESDIDLLYFEGHGAWK